MKGQSLNLALWIAGLALQGSLGVVLLLKRFWRSFPVFAAYALFNLTATGICFSVRSNGLLYFYVYWICEGLSIVLGLAVVFEIFRQLFSVHVALRDLATLVFRLSIVVLGLAGALVVVLQTSSMPERIAKAVLTMAEASRTVEVGLLLFLFLFSTVFGLNWRQHAFGIALGLGLYTSVNLIVVVVHLHLGFSATPLLNTVQLTTFATTLLIWIGYIVVPEPVTTGALPKREELEQWNRAVMEFMHQ